MQKATGSGAAGQSGDRDDTYRSVVTDLAGLMERLELVERAIVVEMSSGKEDVGADIVVLDYVTPGEGRRGASGLWRKPWPRPASAAGDHDRRRRR